MIFKIPEEKITCYLNSKADFYGIMKQLIECSFKKIVLFFLFFLLVLVLIQLFPLKHYFYSIIETVKNLKSSIGFTSFLFFVSVVLYTACGGPRILIYPLAGMLFGFVWGVIIAQAAVILSYYLVFIGCRFFFRRFPFKVQNMDRVNFLFARGGIPLVILIRQIPLYGFLVNIILALTSTKHADFIIGSFVGTLPLAVCCTVAGSSIYGCALNKLIIIITVLLVFGSLLWLSFKVLPLKNKRLQS